MSMNLDKPLDAIIADRPKKGGRGASRGGRRGGRGTAGGAKAAALGGRAQSAAVIAASNRNKPLVVMPGRGGAGSKIILSNLPLDVTQEQVKELFATNVGPLRKVAMSYKANGQSTGVCTVEFQRANDANEAYTEFNNRLIDGKKLLKIEVVVDPARLPAASVATPGKGGGAAANGKAGAVRGKATRGRGRGRGAASGARRESRPKKTVEDLDAEMEDYNKQATNENAAPATA